MCSGAMLTMTDMSKESFCAVQNMDKSGIQWQVSHPPTILALISNRKSDHAQSTSPNDATK